MASTFQDTLGLQGVGYVVAGNGCVLHWLWDGLRKIFANNARMCAVFRGGKITGCCANTGRWTPKRTLFYDYRRGLRVPEDTQVR